MEQTTNESIKQLLNCNSLTYEEAKKFKEMFKSYCRENRTNKISLKWLRGLNDKPNPKTFYSRLKRILRANDLILFKEIIPFLYKKRRNKERVHRNEQRYKVYS